MTKINRVELNGFKSFRKKTVLPFLAGMTAVVGENGSGKSNLFDAISFVMGRRSSQLRAERLEHLIFNGGERYEPAESAEVTLFLDNQEGVFDRFLEEGSKAPEVSLGRRITRKSSTYTFMGRSCPRTTIDEVLEAARIDPDGQQLIAQGRITEIVRRTPLRRREILDEVSGIAAYDEKRNQAILELKEVKSKLNTHRMLLAERHRRLLGLQKERDAALAYQALTQEQERLRRSIAHQRRQRIVEKLRQAQTERQGMDERIGALEKEVAELDREIENKEWELEGMQEDLGGGSQIALVKDVERLRSETLHKQADIEFKRQQMANIQEMIDEISRMRAAAAPVASSGSASRENPAVQALIERKRGGVYGTVASLSTPKAGYEVAFEVAAGGSLSDLVVDSRETAIECINYLKEKHLGRARILPLRRLVTMRKSLASAEAVKLKGVVDYAINLVEFDEKYRRALEYVLTDTLVAESLEAVKDIDGVRVVTLDGDMQSKGGAMSGGWRPPSGASAKKQEPAKQKDTSFDVAQRREHIVKLRKDVERLEEELSELATRLESAEKDFAAVQETSSRAKGEASVRSDRLHQLREKRRESYQGLENLRRSLTKYERQEAEAQVELESIGDVGEVAPADLVDEPLRELERRLEQVGRDLKRLEPVNMRAIDDYATYEADYNLFRERVDALESEKREIERLIGEIEEKKRERFLETLVSVGKQFDEIFRRLFEGGSASLDLEIPGDISSGLLIRANPPDKEPHVIDSLSGGEQTLVATAFICALQENQQAPFFILDEIDAALDLMNATRLARMMRDYAQRMQVIVVSHNEETVRHADRAYGVTIKNGVSEVLALNLS
ncbi:MAG: chromosome segregation SMC family protein [Candidatus Bipolaricaulota bacterium]|nr:chromosome segregation SMC family protein [Candidatus Bipolaricaulota bacterium]